MVADERFGAPIGAGAVAGVAAWILGYVVTYVGAIGEVRADDRTGILESEVGGSVGFEMVGLLFYNAHNVTVDVPQYGILQALDPSHNFVLEKGGSTLVLYGIPVLVLLLAGAAVAAYARDGFGSRSDAALSGATVVAGYLPLVVVGLFVFSIDPGDGPMRPDPLLAVTLAGVLYPLLFGAIGGTLVSVVR